MFDFYLTTLKQWLNPGPDIPLHVPPPGSILCNRWLRTPHPSVSSRHASVKVGLLSSFTCKQHNGLACNLNISLIQIHPC